MTRLEQELEREARIDEQARRASALTSALLICACGSISASFHQAIQHSVCHCQGCRCMSGGMFSQTILVDKSNISVYQGEVAKSSFTATNMGEIDKYTCSKCTSPLWYEQKGKVGAARVFVGAIKDQRWLDDNTPMEEVWHMNRCTWLPELAGIRLARR
ncbi:hypothetical protein F5X99DRAFT_404254 [Biscogniauxia marginata]|nr:hypothetical protein F5X99DRAFT_404254 [Biscogniauxia marginata]